MSSSPDRLRIAGVADADAIVALYTGRRALDAAQVRSWFANATFDADDFRVVERDGRVVGYADVHAEVDRLSVDWAATDPQAGDVLLDWAEERAHSAALDRLVAHEWPGSDDLAAILRARGFAPFRASLEMQVPLGGDVPEPDWPEGIAVEPLREQDERDVHALLEEAFADVHDFRPTPFEEWAAWWDPSRKRLDLWFAARARGELAGVVLCDEERAGSPSLGWVESLAVRRPWRRRGLGRALLLHSFGIFASLGKEAVGLSVQADNPTGAVLLYESVGMRPVSRRVLYEKRLTPAEPPGSRLA